ncbi:MAG: penicillin acylase family protein, partial [Candidatus Marinimicrobia bacterium]|nr:penicillin acylase family protein [Candidatus Neomarinimicrobiota bacterium]
VTGFSRLQGENLNGAWGTELAVDQLRRVLDDDQVRDLIPSYPGQNLAAQTPATAALMDLLAALTAIGQELDAILGSVGRFRGSNNWVVSGSRTATGYPLLANDMHLGFSQPPVWYEMHLVGGRFNVRGVFFPGLPLAMSGNNGHIAWGPTYLTADDTDFYVEEVNPRDSTVYRYRDQWLPFTEREEIIQVKDSEPVVFTVRSTVHGVVINDLEELARDSGQPIAMRWSGQDISDEATAFLKLNLAGNWDDFSAAAALFAVPGQNMVYADREGNIGWRPFVRIPIRQGGASLRLLPGASGKYDWQGYLPFEELPYLYNPPGGYIATANNPTFDDAFPTYISAYWEQPFRVDRIAELLAAREDHTPETFMAIQNDVLSNAARELVPLLLDAYAEPDSGRHLPAPVADALALLGQWDYRMTTESAAATIFVAWFEQLKEVIYRDELDRAGQHTYALFLRSGFVSKSLHHLFRQSSSPWFDNVNTPELEDRAAASRQALEGAVAQLGEQSGGPPAHWTWGRLHTLTHPHALAGGGRLGKFLNAWLDLNVGTFPAPGSDRTVNAINYRPHEGFASNWGPSQRSIVDLADPDNSRMVLPTGQSGNPFSRHYRDQAELYNAGRYRPVDFTREAVERAAVSTLILQP